MGPRAFAHGDFFGGIPLALQLSRLQWGRGLSPTETSRVHPRFSNRASSFNGAAGFRPRRLLARTAKTLEAANLQWGRGLSPTETGCFPSEEY